MEKALTQQNSVSQKEVVRAEEHTINVTADPTLDYPILNP